jgi:hypothetical protein
MVCWNVDAVGIDRARVSPHIEAFQQILDAVAIEKKRWQKSRRFTFDLLNGCYVGLLLVPQRGAALCLLLSQIVLRLLLSCAKKEFVS